MPSQVDLVYDGEGIAYAVYSAQVATTAITDWCDGAVPDLRVYDARLRASLGSTFSRLGQLARAVELSATAVLLALRVSSSARDAAVDAVAGRRAPFGPGGP